jgi:hypothetical protein
MRARSGQMFGFEQNSVEIQKVLLGLSKEAGPKMTPLKSLIKSMFIHRAQGLFIAW